MRYLGRNELTSLCIGGLVGLAIGQRWNIYELRRHLEDTRSEYAQFVESTKKMNEICSRTNDMLNRLHAEYQQLQEQYDELEGKYDELNKEQEHLDTVRVKTLRQALESHAKAARLEDEKNTLQRKLWHLQQLMKGHLDAYEARAPWG